MNAAEEIKVHLDSCVKCADPQMHVAGYELNEAVDQTVEVVLDQMWAAINSLGGTFMEQDLVAKGYCEAVDACLAVIETLGGMDPLQRHLDPRTPEYGVGT